MTTEIKPAATVEVAAAPKATTKPEFKKDFSKRPDGKREFKPRDGRNKDEIEFEERVVDIARVTVVVKGGRRFSFSATVVIGNKKGQVAYGHGKAKEVPDAIKKAVKDARKNLITVPIFDKRTVPHISQAKFVSSNVLLKPAPKGKGIIASGAVRAVVELAGYTDIVTKSIGSSNKSNTVKATLKALSQLRTTEEIVALRDLDANHFKK